MKILVCGSRGHDEWTAFEYLKSKYAGHARAGNLTIIEGGARGGDRAAQDYARHVGAKLVTVKPDWELHGKRAGFLRNIEMLEMRPDKVVAFWDGESKGTLHTITEAAKRGISVDVRHIRRK